MKTRSGIPEKTAFGPARPDGTLWVIDTKNGRTFGAAVGRTAFEACASVGIGLSEVRDIRPQRE